MRWVCVPVLAAVLCGCGEELRLDATTDETVAASLKRMGGGLTKEQKQEFVRSLGVVAIGPAMRASVKASLGKGPEPDRRASATMKPVHGMTVAEVNAKAAEIRAAVKVPPRAADARPPS